MAHRIPLKAFSSSHLCALVLSPHLAEVESLASKIVAEVKAFEAKGGDDGADSSEYTFLTAVETAPQFSCPVCGNKVRAVPCREVLYLVREVL